MEDLYLKCQIQSGDFLKVDTRSGMFLWIYANGTHGFAIGPEDEERLFQLLLSRRSA